MDLDVGSWLQLVDGWRIQLVVGIHKVGRWRMQLVGS